MDGTISKIQFDNLRSEFKEYLKVKHTDWSANTVSMHYSDAFYVFNNNVVSDFWSCFTSDDTLQDAREKIRLHLLNEVKSERPHERSKGYYSSMRYFKEFLDEKHPTLVNEWSGRKVDSTYLKTAFQNWMRRQKKPNGERYAPGTITAYTNALKNSTAKLHLENLDQTDLFFITLPKEFDTVYNTILNAPTFNEVDLTAGNKAYSNGLTLYARFLVENSKPACWIFQGNPAIYDVVKAVNECTTITWQTSQHFKQIKKNDRAYIWVSGPDGGIVASGTILCDPEEKKTDPTDPYARVESSEIGTYLGVDIRIDKNFTEQIVKRSDLLIDDRTKKLHVLTFPGATNYYVTPDEVAVIESIISGNYVRVPITDDPPPPTPPKKYWLYVPGDGSQLWSEFYDNGLMGISWDELGDLRQYASKDDLKQKMKVEYGDEYSYKDARYAAWQFANEMNIGDIVFVRKGKKKIIGRGIISSDYSFDETRDEYKNTRTVEWTNKGEWDYEIQMFQKTLTDITPYTEYCQKLQDLVSSDIDVNPEPEPVIYDIYTESDFLKEVFMDGAKYNSLKSLLLKKKNIILEGAPGVGKTYLAERLAFSIMGKKDISRVKIVQFHQSYSYEDFIMGYRPTDTGFSLTAGAFYSFCKEAETDDREYFFIIDEINRGNLSKIFGELLMLIENDKRGKSIRLLYRDEQFNVPENIHIIGMMNTADRSLALIDYALRRRFSFFEMSPAFESEGFINYQSHVGNKNFDNLVQTVKEMNQTISKDTSLGDGFRIGHSYFCNNGSVDIEWLNALVEYELLPLIREYWFDEPNKIEQWSQRIRGALHD